MADNLFPVANGDFTFSFLNQDGGDVNAAAIALARGEALAYAAYIKGLVTDDGNDLVTTTAAAIANVDAEARGISVGDATGSNEEGRGSMDLRGGDDVILSSALALAPDASARAQSVDASGLTVDLDGRFGTASGDDVIVVNGTAIARGREDSPHLVVQASGFEALGQVSLGEGSDTVFARGVADSNGLSNEATLAFGITQLTADVGERDDVGMLNTSARRPRSTDDHDTLHGEAKATGDDDVGAFGVLVADALTGIGNDTVKGNARAHGENLAQAKGVAVGFSENVPDQDSVLRDEAGSLYMSSGEDTVAGTARATTTSGSDDLLFNDVDAVLVDLNSVLDTGSGMDLITGHAMAVDNGDGGSDDIRNVGLSAVVADGVENRGELLTGDGDDIIEGKGVTRSNEAFSVAGGIDNGLGSTQNFIPVAPVLDTGAGADQLIGTGISRAVSDDAFAGGIENFGTISTGDGADLLKARANSRVTEGDAAGERSSADLSNADGIDNRNQINTGDGNDRLEAKVSARAEGGNADAIGIRNDLGRLFSDEFDLGQIDLGSGQDEMVGIARAVATNGNATAAGISGGTVNTGPGVDKVAGTAKAFGTEDVGATGVLFVDADTAEGNDTIFGRATTKGVGSPDAFGIAVDGRGISVGLSNIDDDSLQNPNNPDGPPARVGTLETGAGDDMLVGRANTVADVGQAEDIFFANATAITNDGGTLEQLGQLLSRLGVSLEELALAVEGELSDKRNREVIEAVETVLPFLDTSTTDTGDGNDTLDVRASIKVTGGLQGKDADGNELGDDDLEVFVEGLENSGTFLTGNGHDHIVANVSGTSVGGAKILVEGIDNSGVGVSTGLNLDDQVNQQTKLDMGAGNDSITVNTRVRGEGDLAAGDGIDTRSNLDMGAGDDKIVLNVRSEFVRTPDTPGDQEEGIADGIENRNNVFLGEGNDSVTARVQAKGNGILTIAEGIESRGFFDAGAGNDTLDLRATAISTEDVLEDNLTQAAGLQTEQQVSSGTFLLGSGDDTLFARGVASSDGLTNKATLAFGITQVTGDASVRDDAGEFDAGDGHDTLTGEAKAIGENEVESFGILFTNGDTGAGDDMVTGRARADGKDFAQANGVAIGVSNNVPEDEDDEQPEDPEGEEPEDEDVLLPDEAGTLVTGTGDDTIAGKARATTTSGRENQLFNDVDAVLVDLNSVLDTGAGVDVITGNAFASDNGDGGGPIGVVGLSAVVADGVENRGELLTGDGADIIEGKGVTRSNQAFSVAGGVDNGLGSTQNGIPVAALMNTGGGADQILGTSSSLAVGANAFAGGIENFGAILTGDGADILQARANSRLKDGEAGDLSNADGIDNRTLVDDDGNIVRGTGLINTGNGDDVIGAKVSARAEGGDATAIGVRNELGFEAGNRIDMGSGIDKMAGVATAVATNGNATAAGISGGTIITGAGDDTVYGKGVARSNGADNEETLAFGITQVSGDADGAGSIITSARRAVDKDVLHGEARASGQDEVEAHGVLLTSAATGFGNDTVKGDARVSSDNEADARGVSIGVSAIGDSDSLLSDTTGSLFMSNGEDTVKGSGNARGFDASAVGVAVTDGSILDTGSGADTVHGDATARGFNAEAYGIFVGGSGGYEMDGGGLVSTSDGVEAVVTGGTISTGDGADTVTGTASVNGARFDNSAAGIMLEKGAVLDTGFGADDVSGEVRGADVFGRGTLFGIAGKGELSTGRGDDEVYASNFGGGVTVDTGDGDDTVTGFGDANLIGGAGKDTLTFEFNFKRVRGEISEEGDTVSFRVGKITLDASGFEEVYDSTGLIYCSEPECDMLF